MTLLSRARARAFSFSSFSLQTLITGSRVEFIHSRASFGSPFCYIDFRRLRFYALFFSVFLRIRTYRVLLYKIWAQSVFDIFLLKNISRKISKSKLFFPFFYVLRRFLPYVTLFKSFARVLLSVCTDDYAVSITLKTIDSNARGTFIQVYSKIFREYESREGTFDRTSSSRFE